MSGVTKNDTTWTEGINPVDADVIAQAERTGATKKTFWGRFWDTGDLEPAERRLLTKVDASILVFASLGYVIKNLDQTNVNNAFLSGMKEELDMYGNQLVTATSIWTVGYVVGQIPINLLLTRVSPRWVIPGLEVIWGLATLGTYAVKNYQALYAMRFLVGLAESGFYPGIHFLLGSWYTPREIGKRASIFWCAGTLGQMFSGVLQSAAYTHLNGVHGLAGWRWLFIIDAIITLPIAVAGFFFLPDLPFAAKPTFWLSQDDINLAQARMVKIGRKGATPWNWAKVKRLFSGWHWFFLPILYVLWNNGILQSPHGYYLKSFNAKPAPVPGVSYTVSQINTLPLPANAIWVVNALAWAWWSDAFKNRWLPIYVGAVISLIFAIVLRVLPVYQSIPGHFAIYYLYTLGTHAGPLILTWINELCSNDHEKRAVLVAAANDFAYVVQAVAPNFVWKTVDFPKANTGMVYSAILQVLLLIWTSITLLLIRRDRNKAAPRRDSEASEDTLNNEHGEFVDVDTKSGSQTPDSEDGPGFGVKKN